MAFAIGESVVLWSAQQPTFRAGVELFRLDVSVIDKDRRPVRGLTAADFTILEDGKPQKVAAFSEVDIVQPPTGGARWMRDLLPDVRTNAIDSQRLIVIVLDDWLIGAREEKENAFNSAAAVIDRLGQDDLAAVVFSRNAAAGQDFTTDRQRLMDAVNSLGTGFGGATSASMSNPMFGNTTDQCNLSSVEVLKNVAQYLDDIHDRRKAIVYISSGVPLDMSKLVNSDPQGCNGRRKAALDDALRAAQYANVNIYSVCVRGLDVRMPGQGLVYRPGSPYDDAGHDIAREFLQVVSDLTGGRAIFNTNRPDLEVPELLTEAGAYYLLGYERTPQPARRTVTRRLQVRVNRKGVEVHARNRYYEPRAAAQPNAATKASRAADAIAGLLPRRDIPLEMHLAAVPQGLRQAAIAAVIGIGRAGAEQPGKTTIEFIVSAFTLDGQEAATNRGTIDLDRAQGVVQVASRLNVPPGRYYVRAGATNVATGSSGSVYADTTVPDFGADRIALSDLVLSKDAGGPLPEGLGSLLPMPPTISRSFASTDRVTAFARLAQGGRSQPQAVSVTVEVTNEGDVALFTIPTSVPANAFAGDGTADLRFSLPLQRLQAGRYLLTVQTGRTGDQLRLSRYVQFSVR